MSFCKLPSKISGKEALGSMLSEHPEFLHKSLGFLTEACPALWGDGHSQHTETSFLKWQNRVKCRESEPSSSRRCASSRAQEGLARLILDVNRGTKNHYSEREGKGFPWENWVYLAKLPVFISVKIIITNSCCCLGFVDYVRHLLDAVHTLS